MGNVKDANYTHAKIHLPNEDCISAHRGEVTLLLIV